MLQNFLRAFRGLSRRPAAHGAVLLVLAAALGATTAMFSIVDAALIQALPYSQPQELVEIRERPLDGVGDSQRVLAGHLDDLADLDAFSDVAGLLSTGMPITSLEQPLNPLMRRASSSYFRLLDVPMLHGRAFLPEEDRDGGPRVVILTYEFWQDFLGGDSDSLGRTLGLDGEAYEIVGVLPPGFRDPRFTGRPVLYLPLALDEAQRKRSGRRPWRLTAIFGRLAPGMSFEAAREQIERLGMDLERTHEAAEGSVVTIESLHETVVKEYRPAVLMLLAASLLVLLIAFSNLALLLLARALEQRRDWSVRRALGASRGRLAQNFLTESLLLSLIGWMGGLVFAAFSLKPLLALVPESFAGPRLESVAIDWRAVLFGWFVSAFFGLLFGLIPLRQALRAPLGAALANRSGGVREGRRARRLLIVAEIALSLVLLSCAGWFLLTARQLTQSPTGFDERGVFTFRTSARGAQSSEPRARIGFYRQAIERLEALPGAERAGGVSRLSISRPWQGAKIVVPGRETAPGAEPRAMVMTSTPGFFKALEIPLLEGRSFTWDDDANAPPAAIVSRSAMNVLFGENIAPRDVVGKSVIVESIDEKPRWVVGVVEDVRHGEAPQPRASVYVPYGQNPMPTLSLALDTSLDAPATLRTSAEQAVWTLNRDAPIYDLAPLDDLLRTADWQPLLLMRLVGGFALLALLLAATGLYAVLSDAAASQRREFALRLALGARPEQIRASIYRQALGLAVCGLGIGLPLTFAAGRFLERQFFGVELGDPRWIAGVVILLGIVVFLASVVPAGRATQTDPAVVLRDD